MPTLSLYEVFKRILRQRNTKARAFGAVVEAGHPQTYNVPMARARTVAPSCRREYRPYSVPVSAGAMFRWVVLLLSVVSAVVLFGLVGCSDRNGKVEPEPDIRRERPAELEALIAEFDRELPRLLERYDVPGAAVALVRDGEPVWSGGYGYADLDSREPVGPETVFEAGSIAKSITAWTVMRLVDQGRLALDDAVITHLPDAVAERLRAANAGGIPAGTLTVGELISNSGGMPFAIGAGDLDDLRQGRMDVEHLRRRAPSGERFCYSNPAFVIAALIVETVSDAPFAGVAQREVLDPLGMHDSGFGAQPRFAESAATGHSFDGTPVRWDDHGPPGAGGLYSTAADLARLLAAYHAQTVLSASVFRAMLDPVIEVGGAYHTLMAEYYALGHFVDLLEGYSSGGGSSGSPVKGVTHGGESGGWLTAYYTIPETGDGFVLLTNSRRSWPLMRLARTWVDAFAIPHPTMVRSYYRLRAAVIGFGVFSGVAAAAVLLAALRARSRRRTRARPGGHARTRARIGAAALVVTGAALLVGWWAVAHGVVSMFFPVLVALPAAGVTLLALVLVAANLPLSVRR